mmetsp:Transcript_23930/g.20947  ORF Transcript_23930/g.20947 Transcript_23930/m.20947 type:complete len:356 (+) Transcript_23930:114-1181(+)
MNKKQAYIFFESNATLMDNQLRNLITDSIVAYREFFKRFEKEKSEYKFPQQIIENEKDFRKDIEDVFLVVKMICQDRSVIFGDSLSYIRSELLKIIDNIVDVSRKFQRAENSIARSEKTDLWPVSLEDEVIQNCFKDIENIIQHNIDAISHVTEIFDKYIFLLREDEVVDRFISNNTRTRKEYQDEINKYEKTYEAIKKEIPFYIRMCMINIDCVEVKNILLDQCTEMRRRLIRAIYGNIHDQNAYIGKEYETIKEQLNIKGETADKIVELEENITRIRDFKDKEIRNSFKDMTDWLFMLYNVGFRVPEEDLSKINITSKNVREIMDLVNKAEENLSQDKDKFLNKLRDTRNAFG